MDHATVLAREGGGVSPFELAEPSSLAEAIGLLDRDEPGVRAVAGGTALMMMMRSGIFRPRRLVSLRRIEPRYRSAAPEGDGGIRIGAMMPLAALGRLPEIQRGFPVIVETLRTLSNVRVRNVATIGGSLAHADPHMDLPPVLIALGAAVAVAGPAGERTIPVAELYTGYFETVLAWDELVTALKLPPPGTAQCAYLKCTTRSADDWPALGIAASLEMAGDIVRDARLVASAATDVPVRLAAAEAALRGAVPDRSVLGMAGEAAAAEAPIVADAQGSAAYKRQLLRVCLGRAVQRAVGTRGRGR